MGLVARAFQGLSLQPAGGVSPGAGRLADACRDRSGCLMVYAMTRREIVVLACTRAVATALTIFGTAKVVDWLVHSDRYGRSPALVPSK
jgi:hypothetical protein